MGLKEVYQRCFPLGAGIPGGNLSEAEVGLLTGNFSSVTAENIMKPKLLQPITRCFGRANSSPNLPWALSGMPVHDARDTTVEHGCALRRAAKAARKTARAHGTPLYVWGDGKVLGLKP